MDGVKIVGELLNSLAMKERWLMNTVATPSARAGIAIAAGCYLPCAGH